MSIPGSANPLLLATAAAAAEAGPFQVSRSLRFDSGSTSSLTKSFSSNGDRQKWTFSFWIKRSKLGTKQQIFGCQGTSDGDYSEMYFDTDDKLFIRFGYTSVVDAKTAAVFRDVGAWMHIVIALDTQNSTANHRLRVYVNGTELDDYSDDSRSSFTGTYGIGRAGAHKISGEPNGSGGHIDGYMAEIHYVNGSQKAPTDFGVLDSDNNWNPKEYSGTYGTNGFYLKCADNTSNASLGADSSGNNNTFTVTNLVATAGLEAAAQGFDVVTYTGNGASQVIGGPVYSTQTLSAVDTNQSVTNPQRAFDGDLTTSSNTTGGTKFTPIGGSQSNVTSLRFYSKSFGQGGRIKLNGTTIETNYDFGQGGWYSFSSSALSNISNTLTSFEWDRQPGSGSNNYDYLYAIEINGTVLIDGDGSDPLGFQPDLVWIKNRDSSSSHFLYDAVRGFSNGSALELRSNGNNAQGVPSAANTGLTSFDSNGFSLGSDGGANANDDEFVAWAWNAGSNSNKTFAVKVVDDSGNKYRFDDFGTSAVTLDLQEGSTYIFDQSDSSNTGHPIRFGTSANGTDYTTGVTHTGTPGQAGAKTTLVLGTGVSTLYYSCNVHSGMGGQINTNSTAGASNFDGSLQATVKTTQDYGFSVVKYEGTGSNATVGHGLSTAPKFFFGRNIDDTSGSRDWIIYHESVGNTGRLKFTTGTTSTSSTFFQDTSPSDSVITIGTSNDINKDNDDYVLYCWSEIAGFSKFGSYSGGTNPQTITTSFKPKFLIIKRTDTDNYWMLIDSERGGTQKLAANDSGEENKLSTVGDNAQNVVEFLDDGFKLTTTNAGTNVSSGTYVYAAFADKPDSSIVDSLIDTPTNADADSGNNIGNCCTWNPLKSTNGAHSEGNLKFVGNNNWCHTPGTFLLSSGKWYFEGTYKGSQYGSNQGNIVTGIGFIRADAVLGEGGNQEPVNSSSFRSNTLAFYQNGYFTNLSNHSSVRTQIAQGDVVGVSINFTAGTYAFYVNNSSVASGSLSYTGPFLPWTHVYYNNSFYDCNFGQRPFAYTPPTDHKSLCTQNLTDPTIADGSDYFDVDTYTGTGNALERSNFSFNPDLLWFKQRSGSSTSHALIDFVRGGDKRLVVNGTNTENDVDQFGGGVTSFDNDGFTLGTWTAINGSGETYVAWAWDAGTTTDTSNDAGSITTSVRANQSAGFSIVTGTGSSSAAKTCGHGLNTEPHFIIVKLRVTAGNGYDQDWQVYHKDLGNTKGLKLNTTAGTETSSSIWNNTSPTSSVFSIGASSRYDGNFVAYCFAPIDGYSKFGSYEGGGSNNFIYTGFRPAFVLIKEADSANQWFIYDDTRDPSNDVDAEILWANSSNSESTIGPGDNSTQAALDLLSNGFRITSSFSGINRSSSTFIYVCFASHPFKTARAR